MAVPGRHSSLSVSETEGSGVDGSAAARIPFCEREGPTGLDNPGLFQDPWGNPNLPRVKSSDK